MLKKGDDNKPKKLHIEIMPANYKHMESYLETYNNNADRVTPCIKYAHVINEALHRYLQQRGGKKHV